MCKSHIALHAFTATLLNAGISYCSKTSHVSSSLRSSCTCTSDHVVYSSPSNGAFTWYTHAAWLTVKSLSTAYTIMSQINRKLHVMEVLGLPHYSHDHVHLKLLRELLLGCSQYSLSEFCLSTCLHFSQNLSW